MSDRTIAITSTLSWNSLYTIKLATMIIALKSIYHLLDEVVDVEEFHFDGAVVDLNRKVVGDVVAEGSYGGVVVRSAPFSEKVRETVDKDLCSCFLLILKHQFLSCLLAAAVLAVAEAAGESGLDATGDHHRAGVAVFLEGIQKKGGEAEVALHELFLSLRTVYACKVEDEVAVGAVLVEFFDC